MTSAWAWWTAGEIAQATGCPAANVADHWPLVADALDRRGIYDRDVARGVIGTVAIESASTFQPVREAFWLPEAWRKANLRYYPFFGRGYVQITWESNYRAAGAALGIDLVSKPDRALEPQIAADVLAWFWATKGTPSKDGTSWYSLTDLCREGDWRWVRRVVQGGEEGLDRLLQIVNDLGESTVPTTIPYNPDAPITPQPDDWSCAVRSSQWILRAVGRNPGDAWIVQHLLDEGIVTREHGLMDASGSTLAAWITREYGSEMGFTAASANPVTFDDVAAGAGVNPTLIGGRRWNHWAGVRRLNADGTLALANPSDGWMGVGQTMSRAQFDALGPFSAVYIDRAGAVAEPPIVPPPDTRLERARELIRQALAILEEPAA